MSAALTVGERYCGPSWSGNGGFVAGLLARRLRPPDALGEAVQVVLRQPPPLGVAMEVVEAAGGLVALHGGAVVAEASPGALDVGRVERVPYEDAVAAGAAFAGLREHPFPRCWVCGTEREDGLGLRPGPVPDRPGTTAAAWTPAADLAGAGGTVPPEAVWAALDCPGGWTVDQPGRPSVLGRMTTRVDRVPGVGERCVVMGRLLREEGRKAFSTTTLYGGDGRALAMAYAVWLAVDLEAFTRRWAG